MRSQVVRHYFIPLTLCLGLSACNGSQRLDKLSTIIESIPGKTDMDLSKITDESVRQAISALQSGDEIWYTYFTENRVLTDDGNIIDFNSFFRRALGAKKFLSIDKVENDGMDIYGNFNAGQWGTFKVFFKFHRDESGQFDRLDIGQTVWRHPVSGMGPAWLAGEEAGV